MPKLYISDFLDVIYCVDYLDNTNSYKKRKESEIFNEILRILYQTQGKLLQPVNSSNALYFRQTSKNYGIIDDLSASALSAHTNTSY